MSVLAQKDFEFLSEIIKKRSGIILGPDKAYLVESRLLPVSRKLGLSNITELVNRIRQKSEESVLLQVTEAMTTNETYFFRDNGPFDLFKNHIIGHLTSNVKEKRKIRIWSAASSSGQEAYSLAICLLEEAAKTNGFEFEIIGTDIADNIVEKAQKGIYSQFEVQRGMPITMLVKYFKQQGENWVVNDKVKSMVNFKKFNLLDNYAPLGQFDLVLIRNVLIYFDQPTKTEILNKISNLMPKHGLLMLGGAETVFGISNKFKPINGPNVKDHKSTYSLA